MASGANRAAGGNAWLGGSAGHLAVLYAVLVALLLTVYRPALRGEFISDDIGYFQSNPFTQSLTASNVVAILDPFGPARLHTANYAPVHLLAHAIEWHVFGEDMLGYHLVNVLVHALVSLLLVVLLHSSGVPGPGALLGGTIFAVHPANVEAVAWISQLKTNGALAFSLGALLARRRFPPLAALLFGLALLTKASAAFALPMAACFAWAGRERGRAWGWLGVWALLLGLFMVPQFGSFGHIGGVYVPEYENPWVQLRSVAAVGMRYLVMAATSYGVAAFQEPPLALSVLHGWWLAALPAGALLAWRLVASLRRRSPEAAWWVGAAASFVPVSQLFPFLHPTADRYLYFLLPGLLGGALVWASESLARRARPLPSPAMLGGLIGSAALALFFALESAGRAKLWRNETLLLVDAAAHYPDGETAHFLSARRAAREGDREAALRALREVADRGYDRFMVLLGDPGLAPLRGDPEFAALVQAVAGRWLETARERGYSTQAELRVAAHAHLVREEYTEAEAAFERALRAGGPLEPVIRQEQAALRSARAAQHERTAASGRRDDRPQTP
jgi:tetratricopeptide (TPR) repeat protein